MTCEIKHDIRFQKVVKVKENIIQKICLDAFVKEYGNGKKE